MSSQIIAEAESWLGTRFKHQGRLKKTETNQGGVDCLGLVMGLGIRAKDGELLSKYDQLNYSKLLTSNILLDNLNLLLESHSSQDIIPGDILLIKVNNWPQHLAIVAEKNESSMIIIHSYLQAKKVMKQYLPEEWYKNIVAVYRSF